MVAWFVLNLGLFMHDRSLFGVCSVKNGGFAKKVSRIRKKKLYPGLTKSILDSQKSILDSQKKHGLVDGIRKKIYPGMKNGGFAQKYPGFAKNILDSQKVSWIRKKQSRVNECKSSI